MTKQELNIIDFSSASGPVMVFPAHLGKFAIAVWAFGGLNGLLQGEKISLWIPALMYLLGGSLV